MGVFKSFLQGGFECATHKNINEQRLDLVAATRHDEFASHDYRRLSDLSIQTVREGARWHLIEEQPGVFDFTSLDRIYDAAQESNVEIILDLMHFGWPDFVDVFSPDFIRFFERFAAMTARFLRSKAERVHFVIPINEISYLAWAGGDQGLINPHCVGRGNELKRQLVKAAIAASQILMAELPSVRLLSAEPVIHVVGRNYVPGDGPAAERSRLAMFEAWDMLTGRLYPELGGRPEWLHVAGLNFYDRNQWVNQGEMLSRDDPRYRPFHRILTEVSERYRCPVFVSETGTEGDSRASWFEYVSAEVRIALRRGVPVKGICLYPIVNHPGWDDNRHCHNALLDYPDADGTRHIHLPLAESILREQAYLADALHHSRSRPLQMIA